MRRSRNTSENVLRADCLLLHIVMSREGRTGESDRFEVTGLSNLLERVEILADFAKKTNCIISLNPAFERWMHFSRIAPDDVEHGVRIRVLHRRPSIRRRRSFVYDQKAGESLARSFFVLVCPAA